VSKVVDSFGNVTSPNVALSEGPSFLTLFGEFPFDQLVLNDALDPELGAVKVLVNKDGTDHETDIYYGALNQMAVRTPAAFQAGSGWKIRVCEADACSAPYRLNVGQHAPFVAAISGNGIGDAAAQDGGFNLVTFSNPMKDIGVLWINGGIEPAAVGKIFLNGQQQNTLYYGASGLDGLTQANIQIDPNTGSGHVTGWVEETLADGTSRMSQPFNVWVETGSPAQDVFLGAKAPQVYSANGLNLADTRFRQTHQVRLNEKGEKFVDLKVFVTDANLLNLNSRTYNAVTPGNPQASIVPFGYADPRQDIPFNGSVAINVPNFTQFTIASANAPSLQQVFTDPAGRVFQGPITVNFSGTVNGNASNFELQGNYERQSAAIDLMEQDFTSNLDSLLNNFPSGVWDSIRRAVDHVDSNATVLFFAGESLTCDQFGSARTETWMTREQVQDLPGSSLEERLAIYEEIEKAFFGESAPYAFPCTSTFAWGVHSWDASPMEDPFGFGSLSYQSTWLVQRPRPTGR
jgi:hypothetical protein